jgi:hypothetical protein
MSMVAAAAAAGLISDTKSAIATYGAAALYNVVNLIVLSSMN